jgi:hypothetical protein
MKPKAVEADLRGKGNGEWRKIAEENHREAPRSIRTLWIVLISF